MRQLILTFMIISFQLQPTRAQQYNQLHELKAHPVKVHYSTGQEQRTLSIVKRVDKAMVFYELLLGFKPTVTLLVLSKSDWNQFAKTPVYGMPHYASDSVLIVAAEDNELWNSFLPPLDQLPPDLREQVKTAYGDSTGRLSMQPFFDLLALHELGHAFHMQAKLNMQRNWMGELFVNILLHTYIAENETGSLPALTLFPRMVINGSTEEFIYTSLSDLEKNYNEIALQYPKNYGWYQCRMHAAAAGIYDTDGKEINQKLWVAFKSKKEKLTDEELVTFLISGGLRTIADMILNWDKNTLK